MKKQDVQRAFTVRCPACGQEPSSPCVRLAGGTGPIDTPHEQRLTAWRDLIATRERATQVYEQATTPQESTVTLPKTEIESTTEAIKLLVDHGNLVVWIEETSIMHSVDSVSRNGNAIQLNCLMNIEDKTERLIGLLFSNMDLLPAGEIRRLVGELFRAQNPVEDDS